MIVRGENGDHVVALQEALERLGHDLPRYGADGWAGSETFNAIEEYLYFQGRADDFDQDGDEIDGDLVIEIIAASGDAMAVKPARPVWPGDWLHDFRLEDTSKQRRQRDWSKVRGITLHQTATCFLSGEDPSDDKVRRALNRVKKIKAHFVILRCGETSFNAPLDREMAHGHAFNKYDVGIEVDGYFAGVHGDDATFWRPKSRPDRKPMDSSAKQVASARAVCKYIVETVASYGGKVEWVHAHRQTHRGKPSDPGQLIWRDVGLYCKNELGLSDEGPDYYVPHHKHKKPGGRSSKAGPGRPIPVQWDPDNTHDYRWKPKK